MAQLADEIRHWRISYGDWFATPDVEATWFIDPPYRGKAGACYPHGSDGIDYGGLSTWCRRRRGQTIVCEGPNADWLPFAPHHTHIAAPTADVIGRRVSSEWIWCSTTAQQAAA